MSAQEKAGCRRVQLRNGRVLTANLMYSMGDSMDTEVFIDCLNRAKEARGRAVMADTYLSFMITDLRYTSTDFREVLRISRFSQSMGSVGDSYDNALAESL